MTRDTLDDLLDLSAPTTRAADAGVLDTMIRTARQEVPRPRRTRRLALAAGALSLVLAGGSAVAIAGDIFPWSADEQDPYVLLSYRLPSGVDCEQRIFNVESSDPAAAAWLRDYARDNDLVALADVDGYLSRLDSWEQPQYDGPDSRLWAGITGAVWEYVALQAQEAGLSPSVFTGMQSQTYCVDADGAVVYPNRDAEW